MHTDEYYTSSIKSITAKKEKKTNPNCILGRLVGKYFPLKICSTGSPVVKNPASNAGDLDLIPVLGGLRSHAPGSGQLSLHTAATGSSRSSPQATPGEEPAHRNQGPESCSREPVHPTINRKKEAKIRTSKKKRQPETVFLG